MWINHQKVLNSKFDWAFLSFHRGTWDSLLGGSRGAGLHQRRGLTLFLAGDGRKQWLQEGLQEGPEPGALGTCWVSGSPFPSIVAIPPGWGIWGATQKPQDRVLLLSTSDSFGCTGRQRHGKLRGYPSPLLSGSMRLFLSFPHVCLRHEYPKGFSIRKMT